MQILRNGAAVERERECQIAVKRTCGIPLKAYYAFVRVGFCAERADFPREIDDTLKNGEPNGI